MKKGLVFLCLLYSTNFLFGTTFTVSTLSQLHSAVDDVVPGDEIIMTNDGAWTDVQIVFDVNGTSNNPITLKAETPGEVIITGTSSLRIGGDYLIVSGLKFENCISAESNLISFRKNSTTPATYSRLTDCMIINCNPSNSTIDYKWIGIYGNNNEVDHCYISGKTHIGATLVVWSAATAGYHHIHHNYFGPRPEGVGNSWETIRIGTSAFAQNDGFNLVEHNYFYQTDGEIEIISGKSSHCTYQYNIFKECKGGLTLRHGTDCRVEGNVFLGENKSGSLGVRIVDKNHTIINNYFEGLNGGNSSLRYPICLMNGETAPAASGYQPVIDVTIAYNTIVNCTKAIMIGAENSRPEAPDGCSFFNNVVTIDDYPPVIHNDIPTDITYLGNFFHRTDDVVNVPSTGYTNSNPALAIMAGDSIYRPSPSSPIVAAAITGLVDEAIDFEGQTRAITPTCGADEISTDMPIDAGIYGPTWLVNQNPLPVELVDFSVRSVSNCAEITWITANEQELDRYYIMRSLDGRDFLPIGQQLALGDASGTRLTYSFEDCAIENLPATTVFYLLHILNKDGTIQKSKIAALKTSNTGQNAYLIHPVNDNRIALFFPVQEHADRINMTFSIYNIKGEPLVKENTINNGETMYFGEGWAVGQYFIHCQYVNGFSETLKWMKTNNY